MSVTTKMSVDVSGFKRGMAEAQASVKTMDAALKKNEAQYKATGNAEDYMSKKADILKQKLDSQNKAAKAAEQALQAMGKNGVDPASQEYQKMAQTLLNAQTAALETQAALSGLGDTTKQAAAGADNLTKSVNGISKKISLDQVITGINKITTGLENAAKKAVQLGQELWNVIMDSAKRADDTATMAQMYGIDLDTFLRMQKLVAGGMDTTVDAMLTAQDKLTKGIGKGSDEVMNRLKELGIGMRTGVWTDHTSWRTKDPAEMFWEVGDALRNMSDAYDKEAAAQTLFGRSWKELVPLFESYHSLEEYNKALEDQTVNSEDAIRNLAELNDAVGKLESSWTTLKDEMLKEIAPALTKGAEAIGGLLDRLTEYLKTEDGQKMLEDLGKAVEGLFEDIGNIDPQEVVEGFVGVFNSVIDALKWLVENKQTVVDAMKAIVVGWGALKLTGGALEILKLIDGLKGLGLFGGSATAAAGSTASTAASAGFTGATSIAAEWGAFSAGGFAGAGIAALPVVAMAVTMWAQSEVEKGWAQTEQGAQKIAQIAKDMGDDWQGDADKLLQVAHAANPLSNRRDGYVREAEELKILDTAERAQLIEDVLKYGERNGFGDVTTSTGNFLVNELERYWGGEAMDMQRIDAITDALQKMYENKLIMGMVGNDMASGMASGMLLGLSDLLNGEIEPEPVEVVIDMPYLEQQAITARQMVEGYLARVQMEVYLSSGNTRNGGGGGFLPMTYNANGLPFVPYDGYLSVLHRGERVMTASENRHYTYNSNNYFGNVNLNNGQDIEALTDAIDRRNRRQRSGYGA